MRQISFQQIKPGQFIFSCPYEQAFMIVERAMASAGVKIKERAPARGLLLGKSRYGINWFGITVTATFYLEGSATRAEVAATLTDAFDTFGACDKKVAKISECIRAMAATGLGIAGEQAMTTAAAPQFPAAAPPLVPPDFAHRAGPSFKGQAITGLFLSLGGLLVGPAAIVGVIMCALALGKMSSSTNKEGKGAAIAGLLVGGLAASLWAVMLGGLIW